MAKGEMMKRFIDLRGQGTGCRFAWWDTIRDEFESFSGDQAWNTWNEFMEVCLSEKQERYKRLCPAWVFESYIANDCEISLSIDVKTQIDFLILSDAELEQLSQI